MALTEQQIANLWVSQGGDPKYATVMAKIAKRESGGRAKINNKGLNKNGTVDWGLYQVNDIWRRDSVVGPLFKSGAILTPRGATKAAIHILKAQGPQAWATYNPSVDRKFIGRIPSGPGGKVVAGSGTGATTFTTPAVDRSSARTAAIAQFVQQGGADNPNAVVGLASLLPTLKDSPAKTTIFPATGQPGSSFTKRGTGPDNVRMLIERAGKIDAKHMPYVWGGGHAQSGRPDRGTGRDPGIGFDCSGAVSAVLGVDPRVSGQFARWGKPGRGKSVTIYANGTHVLMEINGHFFGTSGSNPGGGAGWISRSQISTSYLSRFTARHPAGM